jgi:TPR repeat protein
MMEISELQKKVKTKDPEAMHQLGMVYIRGDKGYENKFEDGYKLIEQSAKTGLDKSLYELGMIHITDKYKLKNVSEALIFFDQASKKKNSSASYELGRIYLSGGLVNKDIYKSEEYLRKSATSKEPVLEAQYLMGYIYLNGIIENQKDESESFRFFEKSADKGHIESMYEVGLFYKNGIKGLIDKDISKSMMYLRKASDKNHIKSINLLSAIYIEESKELLKISSSQDEDAKFLLKELLKIKTDILR